MDKTTNNLNDTMYLGVGWCHLWLVLFLLGGFMRGFLCNSSVLDMNCESDHRFRERSKAKPIYLLNGKGYPAA